MTMAEGFRRPWPGTFMTPYLSVLSPSCSLVAALFLANKKNTTQTTGPIPLASYMRMCLTADKGSYYAGAVNADHDQFGVRGDFITSPEISQVFGELVGIWFVAEWMSQGQPKQGVELIEVGPGRGTLMDDMLRVGAVFCVFFSFFVFLHPFPSAADQLLVHYIGLTKLPSACACH